MQTLKRLIATTELLLIFPSTLFMAAIFARDVAPPEPARAAEAIVKWYTSGPVWFNLWVLLMALPLAVIVIGSTTLLRVWQYDAELRQAASQTFAAIRAHLAMLLVAVVTVTAAVILAIVALHAAAN